MIDPETVSRRCLKVHQWPEQDQALWHAATAKGDIFEDTGPAALWRMPTLRRTREGYGRWLSFLASTGQMDVSMPPAERITRDAVRDYVLVLQRQIQSWTTWSYVLSLWITARIMAPDMNWEWLYRLLAKLKIARTASKNKRARMRPAGEIANWALNRLDAIDQGFLQDMREALQYRNALMIGILIHCPIRLRNLSMIRIDQHLKFDGQRYRIDFVPHEIKTDRYFTGYLPEDLTPYIQRWLTYWRPMLLRDPHENAFWLGIRGELFGPRGIYQVITQTTQAAFGVAINPHLFRDIAVSWVVDMDPAAAGIAAPVLGHTNPKTTEEHYMQANQALAVDRYGQSVNAVRGQLLTEYGNPFITRSTR